MVHQVKERSWRGRTCVAVVGLEDARYREADMSPVRIYKSCKRQFRDFENEKQQGLPELTQRGYRSAHRPLTERTCRRACPTAGLCGRWTV